MCMLEFKAQPHKLRCYSQWSANCIENIKDNNCTISLFYCMDQGYKFSHCDLLYNVRVLRKSVLNCQAANLFSTIGGVLHNERGRLLVRSLKEWGLIDSNEPEVLVILQALRSFLATFKED